MAMCYQNSVSSGKPEKLTKEIWDGLIDSPAVKFICSQIAKLDPAAEYYNERKQALKKKLPIIIPHAAAFTGERRVSAEADPSGLAMLDVDHVAEPRAFLEQRAKTAALKEQGPDGDALKQLLIENGICFVAITASGQGLRVIGERMNGESIEQAQMRMAEALGIKEFDAVTKDLARASYVVPRDYILWMDEEELLSPTNEGVCEVPKDESLKPLAHEVIDQQGEPKTYREIPYSEIVEQLMIAMGNAGGAVQGERNTTYFALANYMRYICDFNAELLLAVLPDFGLSEQERKQAITSALGRPRRDQTPMILQGAIAMAEKWNANSPSKVDGMTEKKEDLALPRLPRLLKLLCRRLPKEYRPAMIIASLPVLGTLATRVRFHYLDSQEQSLSFFSCITAPAASGKSFIRKPIDLLLTPITEQDAIEREKEQTYKEKLRASKNSKMQPEDPHACPRNNGVSISIAKLLQLMTYAEGKHLIGIGEEMDTLVKSEKAGAWSQKSDIYRLAFDNAEYGQAYMSEASFNAHIHVYYNLLLTGTPNSMRRFFKDLENGLATRVAFAQLPDTSFTKVPVFAPYEDAEKAEIIRWARELDAIGKNSSDTVFFSCPELEEVIDHWLEQKRQQALEADNHAMDTFRRRAGVMGFRAGILCYLLENRKFTKTVAEFAEWVAEYVFRNQMDLWGEQMELELTGALEAQSERGAVASLLALLPKEFTTNDLIKLRARKGQSVKSSAICMVIKRWCNNKRIRKIDDNKWLKI